MNNTDVANEVYRLLDEHGLIAKGWKFRLSNSKRVLGQCRYREKEILISGVHIALGADADVMDTVRHEIAHAVTGPGHHHDRVWKANARMLGATPRAATRLNYDVPHKYEIHCGCCEKTIQKRHRRMAAARLAVRFCRRCGKTSKGQLSLVSV